MMNKIRKILLGCLLLGIGGSAYPLGADPAAHVPVSADAALYLRIARLKQIPVLARLADSGEIGRLEKPLEQLLVTPDAFIVAYFGMDERLVLADVSPHAEKYKQVYDYFMAIKDRDYWYEVKSHTVAGMPAVTKIFYLPPRKPYHSYYEAVWVADDVAAFGDDDYPLPHSKLVPAGSRYRELSAPGTLAAALIPDPSRFGFDVMGLAQQLRNVRLFAQENARGILLSGSADVRDAHFLEQTAQLLAGAVRIFMVSFFGDNEALCQSLIQKLNIQTANGRLSFYLELDNQTLLAIQNYYDGHAAQLKQTLKNNVQKTK